MPKDIDMTFDCTGHKTGPGIGREAVTATLRLNLSLDEREGRLIVQNDGQVKRAYVEVLNNKGGEKLWPVVTDSGGESILISDKGTEGRLRVTFGSREDVIIWNGGHKVEKMIRETELICQSKPWAGDGEFLDGKNRWVDVGVVSLSAQDDAGVLSLRLKVLLGPCQVSAGRGQVTCDLKITTGSNME